MEKTTLVSSLRNLALTNDTEKAVARIYADILRLEVADVSVADNFFVRGGTSDDVMRLKSACESAFDIHDIPVIQILKHPAVSSLAKYIDASKSDSLVAEEYDPVVPLNLAGNRTPIFMVHSGVGDAFTFVNLSRYFYNERPFYALCARGFGPRESFFASLDEIVSCYASAVKRTQPRGPYAIAGYSYGGIIAFEIAKRLEAVGDQVKFTGIIDVPPRIAEYMRSVDWTANFLSLSHFFGLVSGQDVHDLAASLRPLSHKEQLDALWKLAPAERLVQLQLTPEKYHRWIDVAQSLIECGKQHNPSGSVSIVDVFYGIPPAGTKEDWLKYYLSQWTEFSRGEPAFADVPGEHNTLIDLDHVPEFQRVFRGRLEARGV